MACRLPCLLVALALAGMAGCSRDPSKDDAPRPADTLRTAADGMTGRSTVEHGRQTREAVERISAQRDQELQAVLGDSTGD